MQWYLMVLQRYAEFDGRSRRMEYWMFALFNFIIGFVLGVIEGFAGISEMIGGFWGPLSAIYVLATLIPGLAVSVRRLHDTNKSGWWLLIVLIPLIGALVLLVFMLSEGDRGSNRFGPDPKGRASKRDVEDDNW